MPENSSNSDLDKETNDFVALNKKSDELIFELKQLNVGNRVCFVYISNNNCKFIDSNCPSCCENKCVETNRLNAFCMNGNIFIQIKKGTFVKFISYKSENGTDHLFNIKALSQNNYTTLTLFDYQVKFQLEENAEKGIGLLKGKNYVAALCPKWKSFYYYFQNTSEFTNISKNLKGLDMDQLAVLITKLNQALQEKQEEENMNKSNADINFMVQQSNDTRNEFHTSKDQFAAEEMSTVDRSMDSTLLATNAAKSFGCSYLFWRVFFGLKDIILNTYAQRRGLNRTLLIFLGLVFFYVAVLPILLFALFLAIPVMFLMSYALFFIYMFGGMPKLLSILDRLLNIFFGNRRDGNGEGTNRISDCEGRVGTSGTH